MNSYSKSSILKGYKEFLSQNNFFSDDSMNVSNTELNNLNETNNNNLENNSNINSSEITDTNIIISLKNESISHNSIEPSFSNKLNLSSKIYQSEKSKIINNYKLICKSCNNFPQISFNKNNTLNLVCDCKTVENMEYNYFIDNYIFKSIENQNESKIIIENYCFCEVHYKPYTYYCEDCTKTYNKICGRNLCDDCIKEKNLHSGHIVKFFDNNMFYCIQKITQFIKIQNQKKLLNNSENENSYDYFNEKFENFLTILKMILISSKNYFSFNIYKTINTTKNYLDKIKIVNENTFNNKTNENIIFNKSRTQLVNIKEKREFIYIKNVKYHEKIKSIEIIKNNIYDISILNKTNLINLEILSLADNNIRDISPIKNINAPNLKKLNLSTNKITDKYIYVINDMNFPNITFINLARNYLHDYNIFKCFGKYKYLETLYIGTNNFENNYIDNNKIIYEMQYIKEISISKGVFSNITIKLISNFNLINLEDLHLSGNNLCSLDFVKYLNCKNLQLFCAYSNNIKDYYPLIRFINLSDINLQNNPIKDISKLKEFVEKLRELNKFDLSDTLIEKNKENLEIIKNIRKTRLNKGKDIKIKY